MVLTADWMNKKRESVKYNIVQYNLKRKWMKNGEKSIRNIWDKDRSLDTHGEVKCHPEG